MNEKISRTHLGSVRHVFLARARQALLEEHRGDFARGIAYGQALGYYASWHALVQTLDGRTPFMFDAFKADVLAAANVGQAGKSISLDNVPEPFRGALSALFVGKGDVR